MKKSWGDKKLEKVQKALDARDETSAEEKIAEKAVEEKADDDKPAEETAVADKPVGDEPAVEKSIEDKPVEEKSVEPTAEEKEAEEAPKKKVKLAKNMTMAATAEVRRKILLILSIHFISTDFFGFMPNQVKDSEIDRACIFVRLNEVGLTN